MYSLFIFSESFTNGYRAEILDFFSLASILCGIFVVISKNPIVSVLFLIGLFLSISSYLIMLGLNFVGLSYLLVYVGAVSILFLFILMLINVRISELLSDTSNSIPLVIIIASFFTYPIYQILPYNITASNSYTANSNNSLNNIRFNNDDHRFNKIFSFSSDNGEIRFVTAKTWDGSLAETTHITSIGNIMYTSYSIWLIITSIILLLAMVGAIVITIKQKELDSLAKTHAFTGLFSHTISFSMFNACYGHFYMFVSENIQNILRYTAIFACICLSIFINLDVLSDVYNSLSLINIFASNIMVELSDGYVLKMDIPAWLDTVEGPDTGGQGGAGGAGGPAGPSALFASTLDNDFQGITDNRTGPIRVADPNHQLDSGYIAGNDAANQPLMRNINSVLESHYYRIRVQDWSQPAPRFRVHPFSDKLDAYARAVLRDKRPVKWQNVLDNAGKWSKIDNNIELQKLFTK